ncbi:MAG: VanZ family protein [Aerococcus sp.]|nr:VanZ family protein [Aerococcus sp.]
MNKRKLTQILFIYYLIILTWVIVFKMSFPLLDIYRIRQINLMPFVDPAQPNGPTNYFDIVANILAFIPFGLFMHIFWRMEPLWKQWLPMLEVSLLFECLQWTLAVGRSDITDVITNAFGGLLGILLAWALRTLFPKHWITLINGLCVVGAIGMTFVVIIVAFF